MVLLLLGCTEEPAVPRLSGTTDDVFREISRVVLDTAAVATIGRLNAWLPLPEQILVADGIANRVLSFTPDGTYQTATGGPGNGPGEFQTPLALIDMPNGNVLVADFTPRLTEIAPDLSLHAVHQLTVSTFVGALSRVGEDFILAQWATKGSGDNFVRWTPGIGLGASFDPTGDPVPYWTRLPMIAPRHTDILVADNMAYPLRRYSLDGVRIDTVGSPPPSWRQAPRPTYGEFSTPEGQRRAQGWLRSFSVIDGVHTAGESWLIVTHRDPTTEYREEDTIRADVYTGDPLTKVWEDILLPGPIVRSDDECVWVIVEQPPSPWAVACWAPRAPGGDS